MRLRKIVSFTTFLLCFGLGLPMAQADNNVCRHKIAPGQNLTKLARALFPNAAQGKKGWSQIIFQDNGLLDLLISYNTDLNSIHTLRAGQTVNYPCKISVNKPIDYYKPIISIDGEEFVPKGKARPNQKLASGLSYTKLLGRSGSKAQFKKSRQKPKIEVIDKNACHYTVKKGDRLTKLTHKLFPSAGRNRKEWAQLIYQDDGLLDLITQYNPDLGPNPALSPGKKIRYPCEISVQRDESLLTSDGGGLTTSPQELGIKNNRFKNSTEACLYTVRPGDHLSRMVQRFYPKVVKTKKEWRDLLYRKNGLIDLLVKNNDNVKSVDLIYPGMSIVYPCDISALEKQKSRNLASPSITRSEDIYRRPLFRINGNIRHFVQGVRSVDELNQKTGEIFSNLSLGANFQISYAPSPHETISVDYELRRLDFDETSSYQEQDFKFSLHGLGIIYQTQLSRRWSFLTSFHYRQESAIRATSTTTLKFERVFLPQVGFGGQFHYWSHKKLQASLLGKIRYLIPTKGGDPRDIQFRSSWHFGAVPRFSYSINQKWNLYLDLYNELILLDLNFSSQSNFQIGPQIGVSYEF